MEHNPASVWFAQAAGAADQPGTGNLLRIILVVMLVGCVLTAWFLLRGYKRKDD